MKPCTKFEERISEMLFGDIPENECQKLHMHMSGCEGCMSFYLSLYETLETDENEDFSLTEGQKKEIFEEAEKLNKPIKKFSPLWTTGVSVAASLIVSGIVIMSDSNLSPKMASEYKSRDAGEAIEIAVAMEEVEELKMEEVSKSLPQEKSKEMRFKSDGIDLKVSKKKSFAYENKRKARGRRIYPDESMAPAITTVAIENAEANDAALEDTNDEAPSTDDNSLDQVVSDIIVSDSSFVSPSVIGGRSLNGRVAEKKAIPRKEESLDLVINEEKPQIEGLDAGGDDLVGGIGYVAGGEEGLAGGLSQKKFFTYQDGHVSSPLAAVGDEDPFAEADPFAQPDMESNPETFSFGFTSDGLTGESLEAFSERLNSADDEKKERQKAPNKSKINNSFGAKDDNLKIEESIKQNKELEADNKFSEAQQLMQDGDLEGAKGKIENAIQQLSELPKEKRVLAKKEKYQEFYGSLVQVEDSKRPMLSTQAQPMSTFSIDVDTASYQLAKQMISSGQRPDPMSIRAEEFINYFDYKYVAPKIKAFKVHKEVVNSPFHRGSKIMKIAIQGKQPGGEHRAASHFCFIVDTSGSMANENRLPMVKKVLPMIIKQMTPGDKVSLVSCGLKSRLELDYVDVKNADFVAERIRGLNAVGATNLEASLLDGYRQVQKYIRKGVYSRVILFSDGVANLGEQNANNILQNLQHAKEQGAGITVIGMGEKEYNDNFLETLADKGDGNYVFIGNNKEAQKTFEEKFAATFHTIAYNVKIQVEFDPNQVSKYRLLGYENRRLKNKDFRNDKVDAGEVGSGQSVTAIYEVEMTGRPSAKAMAEVRLRYRDAVDNQMHEFATPVLQKSYNRDFEKSSQASRLAFISGKFAEVLRDGGSSEGITVESLLKYLRPLASQMNNSDVNELLSLIEKSR